MADQLIIVDAKGDKVPVDLSVDTYRAAADNGQSLSQYLANQYPTNADRDGTAYQQLLEQTGIFVRGDQTFGLRPSRVGDLLNPKEANATVTRDGIPASRLLFPAVILDVIEDKLNRDLSTSPNALNAMVGMDESIQGDRWERPVLNFSKPEAARSAPVSQLALPNTMLTITASDKSMRIPTWGIGMEISEQAQRSTTLDLVGLAMARQAAVERNERAQSNILSLLNGDADFGMAALSSVSGKVRTAQSFDSTISTAGTITYKAWLSWLVANSNYRTITHIVTDLPTLLKLRDMLAAERVAGTQKDNPSIDIGLSVLNPSWPSNITVFLTDDANWPANTIMGLDRQYAIHRVRSLTAQYSAVEQFVLRRATALRVDQGDMLYRFTDEAFEVLTLTV